MSATAGRDTRDVVPRWRNVAQTLLAAEFPVHVESPVSVAQLRLLDERLEDWKAHGSEVFAIELVGTALALDRPEVGQDALTFLEQLPENALLPLFGGREAASDLDAVNPLIEANASSHKKAHAVRVAQLRKRVRRDPRRAIAWSELARSYVALGLMHQAEHALSVALAIAPNHRYFLRNAVCFFISTDRPDQAHALVSRAEVTPTDPWLLAAELTAAHVADEAAKFVKRAREVIDSAAVRPSDVSEVASELATMEMEHGNRKAKKLFARAMLAPNDNSLAQIEWASQRLAGIVVGPEQLADSTAAEARSLHALREGNWSEAVGSAQQWLSDQFFSVKAAMVASYAAAAGLMEWRDSYAAADLGLQIHPDDVGLLNNAAYALVELGEYQHASQLLARIGQTRVKQATHERGADVAAVATHGLFAFRTGDVDGGRRLYYSAIAKAHGQKLRASEALAMVMLAREELRIGSNRWAMPLAGAINLRPLLDDPGISAWIERLQQSAENGAAVK